MTHNPFIEFRKDKYEYARARFVALACELRCEGLKPYSICNQASHALWDGSFQTPRELLAWLAAIAERATDDVNTVEQIVVRNRIEERMKEEKADVAGNA